jgi:hypothetical protein
MLYRPAPTAVASRLSQLSASAPAEPASKKTRRHYRSHRRHFKDGVRRSARRALDAAGLYLAGIIPTLAAAAETCAVAKHYVAAAVTILKVEDPALEAAILDGRVQLLAAARAMKPAANLIAAFRAADHADTFNAARALTTGVIWDRMIAPVIDGDTTAPYHAS